jgi:ankyrin repeat protein
MRRSVNSQNEDEFTPLLMALSKGNLGIFWLLLAQGADAFKFASGRSVRDNNGNTPLHLAVIGGHLEVARMLLECKADVNSRNEDGSTPLLIVSSKGNLDTLRLLLTYGADASVSDNKGRTPRHLAEMGGHHEVAHMLPTKRTNEFVALSCFLVISLPISLLYFVCLICYIVLEIIKEITQYVFLLYIIIRFGPIIY